MTLLNLSKNVKGVIEQVKHPAINNTLKEIGFEPKHTIVLMDEKWKNIIYGVGTKRMYWFQLGLVKHK